MWARLINVGLGVWLMAAPAVFGSPKFISTNFQIAGPLIISFATIAIWQATRPLRWVNLVLGAWLIVSPLVLGYGSIEAINSVVVGVAVALLSLVRGTIDKPFDGGWSMIWKGSEWARQDDRARPVGR